MMSLVTLLEIYGRRFLQRLKRYDSNQSRKRLLIIVLGLCIVFFYTGPAFLRWLWKKTPIMMDTNVQCVENHIGTLIGGRNILDNNIRKSYNFGATKNQQLVPYVGNGLFGLVIDDSGNKPMYIAGKRSLDLVLPFNPIIHLMIEEKYQKSTIIRFTDGVVHRITCFTFMSKSATIIEKFYAHRTISPLLIQEIEVSNPSNAPLSISIERELWTDTTVKKQTLVISGQMKEEYDLYETKIDSGETLKSKGVIIIVPKIQSSITVRARSQASFTFKTFVNYTNPIFDSQLAAKIPQMKTLLKDVAKKVVDLIPSTVIKTHSDAWRRLWSSGFGISYSKAEGSLNGDIINATIYYILSQRLLLDSVSSSSKTPLLFRPNRCYMGHSTLLAPALWSNLDSVNDINRIVSLWLLTLEKQGCHNLIEAGAEGTMQAAILSMSALQFTKDHLELNADPKDLHREYFIRRIRYGNSTFINITVNLGLDNKAVIYTSLENKKGNQNFYACDGGCLDAPVMLSSKLEQFPVKLTDPRTAILYITPDRQHISVLKHTIHVSEVAVAPAHEHHIIALHRHGHQLGGLPALFWVSIIFLIVIFHLFLAKLIYNEYCSGTPNSTTYERGKYAV